MTLILSIISALIAGVFVWLILSLRQQKQTFEYQGALKNLQLEKIQLEEKRHELISRIEGLQDNAAQSAKEVSSVKQQFNELQVALGANAEKIAALQAQIQAKDTQLNEKKERLSEVETALKQTRETATNLHAQVSYLQKTISENEAHQQDKIQFIEETQQSMKQQFASLANEVLQNNHEVFRKESAHNIHNVINPLRDKIKEFELLVASHQKDNHEQTGVLKTQIEQLAKLNQHLASEAHALTDALAGTRNKRQGIWGEGVLLTLLEAAGLQSGVHFQEQKSVEIEHSNDKIAKGMLDVLLHLPDNRHLIIDAKVSLTAYTDYCNIMQQGGSEEAVARALQNHVTSVRNHMKTLASKEYTRALGVNTLDFVIMFMPAEHAFVAAVNADKKLMYDCVENNVVVTGPSSLLATLRTVEAVWRLHNQNKNAQQIIEKSVKLHQKLVLFLESWVQAEKMLDKLQDQFGKTRAHLSLGRGNLMSRIAALETLGVQSIKKMPDIAYDAADEVIEGNALAESPLEHHEGTEAAGSPDVKAIALPAQRNDTVDDTAD